MTPFEVTEPKLASPEYVATTVWLPTVNVEMDRLAEPLVSVTVLRFVDPSLKVIVPVGVEVLLTAETNAWNTTVWPNVEGFGADASVTVVPGVLGGPFGVVTVTVTGFDVLLLKLLLPRYVAVKVCEPAARLLSVILAVPTLRVAVPIIVPPSRNCTCPVAVKGETAAVSVNDCVVLTEADDAESDVVVLVGAVPMVTVNVAELALKLASPA